MPIPFILGGIAIASAIGGAAKGVQSYNRFSDAKEINKEAKHIFESQKGLLNKQKNITANSLKKLGSLKLEVWGNELSNFVKQFDRVKNIELKGNSEIDKNFKASIEKAEIQGMKDLSMKAVEVLSGGVGALGTGALAGVASYGGAMMFASASTGTAISSLSGVAATNATMAWFGGGALSAGGFGMAGGALVLGGIVTGPILLAGGWMLSAKAQKNLEDAKANLAKSKQAVAQMKQGVSLLKAIEDTSKQFIDLLSKLRDKFKAELNILEYLLNQNSDKGNIDYTQLSEEAKYKLHLALQFAQVTKQVTETSLLNKNGSLNDNCLNALSPAKKLLNT
ncbi:MAG: hypothetical protein JXR36_13565 [Bacteroidales bacterium]|nr:hypothetical protein [Bacteroidales bacterium]